MCFVACLVTAAAAAVTSRAGSLWDTECGHKPARSWSRPLPDLTPMMPQKTLIEDAVADRYRHGSRTTVKRATGSGTILADWGQRTTGTPLFLSQTAPTPLLFLLALWLLLLRSWSILRITILIPINGVIILLLLLLLLLVSLHMHAGQIPRGAEPYLKLQEIDCERVETRRSEGPQDRSGGRVQGM